MARAIDKIRGSYNAAKRKLVVPEFENLELWFGPLVTSDMQAVAARDPKDAYEQDLFLLIHKAQNEDGTPAFQMGDLHYLRSEGNYLVLRRIIGFMYESSTLTEKEAAKQIAEDPTSASAST